MLRWTQAALMMTTVVMPGGAQQLFEQGSGRVGHSHFMACNVISKGGGR